MADNAIEQQVLQQDSPEVAQLQQECNELEKLQDGYNRSLTSKTCFLQELEMENRSLKVYLKAKEKAFFELMANYEKCKSVMEGYRQNEEILDKHMATVKTIFEVVEEKYDSLKKHAFEQVEKANTEMSAMHAGYEKKLSKQVALMKGIEIKYNCLMRELEDKTKQCHSIEDLISELTDKM